MTFPGSASATATFGDYADIAALHAATKASVDAVTAKLEAIRNDNTAAAVTQSGTWQVNLGTLNGAATAAKQDTLAAVNATIGTRAYGTPSSRLTVNATDTASSGLTATEVLLHASTRCFVLAGAAATNAAIPLEAGEKFHMRLTSGQQIHVIQDTAGGFLNVIPVA